MRSKTPAATHSTRCVHIQLSKLTGESANTGVGAVILMTPAAISEHDFQLIKQ